MLFKNKKSQTSLVIAGLVTLGLGFLGYYYNISTDGKILMSIFLAGFWALILIMNFWEKPSPSTPRSGAFTAAILMIILLTIGSLSWYYGHRMPPDDKFIGLIQGAGKELAKVGDSAFNWLFGARLGDSIKKIAGIRAGKDFWQSLALYAYFGFVAGILMNLGTYISSLIQRYIKGDAKTSWMMYYVKNYQFSNASKLLWLDFVSGSFMKIIIFALVYTTLMQIGVINRVIQLITFYWLTNWFIYPFILAIIFGYLPEILLQLGNYYRYMRYQRVVMETKAGMKAARMFGKS